MKASTRVVFEELHRAGVHTALGDLRLARRESRTITYRTALKAMREFRKRADSVADYRNGEGYGEIRILTYRDGCPNTHIYGIYPINEPRPEWVGALVDLARAGRN